MALKQAPNESVGSRIYVFTHAFDILFLLAFTQGLCTNFDRPLSHRSMHMILIYVYVNNKSLTLKITLASGRGFSCFFEKGASLDQKTRWINYKQKTQQNIIALNPAKVLDSSSAKQAGVHPWSSPKMTVSATGYGHLDAPSIWPRRPARDGLVAIGIGDGISGKCSAGGSLTPFFTASLASMYGIYCDPRGK